MARLNFNAANKEPMEERKLLPEGEYIASIVKSEIVDNSKKTGTRLNFQFKVLNGESKGSIIFVGLNYTHQNQVAVDISEKELKSICDAAGKGDQELTDTDELHGIPMKVTVKHSAPSGEYEEAGETKYRWGPKAEIKKYEPAENFVSEDAPVASESPSWANN